MHAYPTNCNTDATALNIHTEHVANACYWCGCFYIQPAIAFMHGRTFLLLGPQYRYPLSVAIQILPTYIHSGTCHCCCPHGGNAPNDSNAPSASSSTLPLVIIVNAAKTSQMFVVFDVITIVNYELHGMGSTQRITFIPLVALWRSHIHARTIA